MSKTSSEKYQEYKDWLNEIPEISDEEIEKASQQTYPIKGGGTISLPTRFDLDQYNRQIGFVAGTMWYREQLKNIDKKLWNKQTNV